MILVMMPSTTEPRFVINVVCAPIASETVSKRVVIAPRPWSKRFVNAPDMVDMASKNIVRFGLSDRVESDVATVTGPIECDPGVEDDRCIGMGVDGALSESSL